MGADKVEVITGAIDLFSKDEREKAIAEAAGEAAKADTIASNTSRVLEVKWKREDPAFYKKFSRMLKDAIEAFREGRMRAAEYLQTTTGIMNSVLNRSDNDIPTELVNHDVAQAYYGSIREVLDNHLNEAQKPDSLSAEAALSIERIIEKRRIVNWTDNTDVKNRIRQDIEDYLFDFKEQHAIDLSYEDIDIIIDECLEIAEVRRK